MQNKKDLNVQIGANIKRARENAGLTQDKLSEMIGLGVKSLSAIERGTVGISLASLCKLCQVLSVSSDDLLFGPAEHRDMGELSRRIERLPAAQYKIASDIMTKLLEAFHSA